MTKCISYLMQRILDAKSNLDSNIQKVQQIVNIGSDIGLFIEEQLKKLDIENQKYLGFSMYKEKLNRVISSVHTIKELPEMKEKYEIIRNQAVVLLVQNMESFLNEVSRVTFDEYPSFIDWQEKRDYPLRWTS